MVWISSTLLPDGGWTHFVERMPLYCQRVSPCFAVFVRFTWNDISAFALENRPPPSL